MNIIAMRKEERAKHMRAIEESINKAREENPEKHIDFKNAVLSTMSNLNLSRRTAIEYVELAFFNLNLEK